MIMTNIFYEEHGYKILVTATKEVGDRLPGMRAGKPFLSDGKAYINHANKLHEIIECQCTNESGEEIDVLSAKIDIPVRIAAVIARGGKVLVLHRVKNNKEYYIFPGGHQLIRETSEEALVREVEEEVGLDVSNCKFKLLYEYSTEGYLKADEKFYLIEGEVNFDTLLKENPDTVEGEINAPMFLDLEEALQVDIFPKSIIRGLVAGEY